MATLVVMIHILICLLLVGIVLLQGGKGADLGSAFGGGSSQTLFGGRGAATFMNKMTTVVAILFMVTSLILTLISVRKGSVIKAPALTGTQSVPASPGGVKAVPAPAPQKPQVPESPAR